MDFIKYQTDIIHAPIFYGFADVRNIASVPLGSIKF
jgi:hypothetical protein